MTILLARGGKGTLSSVCTAKKPSTDRFRISATAAVLAGTKSALCANKLWLQWQATKEAKSGELPKSFSAILLDFKVPAKAKMYWDQMCYTLDELVTGDGESFSAPTDMIFSILEGVYDDYMKDSFDNYENRRQDIEQLMQYATAYLDVEEFLAQLSLMSSVDGDPSNKNNNKKKDETGVTLSSIHQAKGLEWKVVFLIWLADGMFPNGRVLEADDNKMLEEERRLFYVALTRAKDQLYLSYPMNTLDAAFLGFLIAPAMFMSFYVSMTVQST